MQNIIGHLGPNSLNLKKYPTSNAHNFVIENPNDSKFKSILILLRRSTTFMLEIVSFEACIMREEGFDQACFWLTFSK